MPKINIDLRFVDVLYELEATAKYITAFENQLPSLVKQEEKKGLSIESGSLMFSKGFIEEMHYNVNTFLTHLIADVKMGIPRKANEHKKA